MAHLFCLKEYEKVNTDKSVSVTRKWFLGHYWSHHHETWHLSASGRRRVMYYIFTLTFIQLQILIMKTINVPLFQKLFKQCPSSLEYRTIIWYQSVAVEQVQREVTKLLNLKECRSTAHTDTVNVLSIWTCTHWKAEEFVGTSLRHNYNINYLTVSWMGILLYNLTVTIKKLATAKLPLIVS